MAKKKSNNNNNNNNNNNSNNKEIKNEELFDSDEGEWTNVPTKEEKNRERKEKKELREQEKKKKRDQELKEHNEKQKKIAELFSDSSKAFSVKNRPTNYNPWDILDDDASDNEVEQQYSHSKKQIQTQENANSGFSFQLGKLAEIREKEKQQKLKLKQKKQKQQQQQQKLQQGQSNDKLAFTEAIKTFDFEKYYELLKNVETKFPSVIDIQVQYVSEFLENHFGKVPSDQSLFNQRIDYLSKFDEKFKTEMIAFFQKKPINNIIPTVIFLANNIISILRKDKGAMTTSGVGHEILLQVILRYFPDALLKNVNHFKSLNLPSLKPNVVSLYLWLFYQPINTNPSVSASLWLQIIFPSLYKAKINNEQNSELFIKFSDLLFESKKIQKNGLKIDDQVLESVLDEFINALILHNVQPIAMKYSDLLFDIEKLFPNNKVSSVYFLTLLNYCVTSDENLRNMVLSKAIDCLNMDKDCYGFIKSKYIEVIAQVNNLLLYILLQWKTLQNSGIQLINLNKQNIYELALYSQDENNNLTNKYNQNKNNSNTTTNTTVKTNKKGKQPQQPQQKSSNYDIEEVNLCNQTCDAVISSFKPSHIIRNISIVLVPVAIAICGYYSRDPICNQFNHNQLLQKYLCN